MVNIFQHNCSKLLVSCTTALAFTCVTVAPPSLMAYEMAVPKALNLNDINFSIKIEKIYEKVKKAIDRKETNKIVGYMWDFKKEVEQYTGKKIDINKSIDQAEQEARKNGQKIDSKYLKAIKKEFHKNDKKDKHRAVWFAQCAELDIPYTYVEADAHFEMNYAMAKSAKGHNNDIDINDVKFLPVLSQRQECDVGRDDKEGK